MRPLPCIKDGSFAGRFRGRLGKLARFAPPFMHLCTVASSVAAPRPNNVQPRARLAIDHPDVIESLAELPALLIA